ncbi:hypothetical protein [Spiroplasma endosymbiont of Amphibalanus improvisus]|uniref:hypothetical protein n=1 Tax=Spiroplasma endosymbiont of Amphibalanus improvisus TaxID=3066327 RepID=UPI00313DB867
MNSSSNQIFEDAHLKKQKFLKIKDVLSEMNLSSEMDKIFKKTDKYDIISNNFIYLLRLNKMNVKDHWESIIFIKLIYSDFIYRNVLKQKYKIIDEKEILTKIKNFLQKIEHKEKNNWESILLKNNKIDLPMDELNFINHELYLQIANIFYNTFFNKPKAIEYYNYAYFLTAVLTIDGLLKIMNKKHMDNKPLLYILKLNFFDYYEKSISQITNIYFNYFVCQNNFFLNKNRRQKLR